VELVAIVSDEPDDDIADGATTDDIQGATFGTDDRDFELRCERQGKSDGRVYNVTYQARDASDNTTDETDDVTVPKSQGGAG
jgi:endo-1,4-beta-xylanase